jgi:pimeloyl-ACP methyl ester carboxylesterase
MRQNEPMRFRGVVLLTVMVVAGCGNSKASPATSPASTPASTAAPGATAATTTGATGTDIQTLNFKAADGTVIDYVMLVPPGRAVGQPGKVLFTFPPGGQDLELTQNIVAGRWHDEALARGWVVVSPAAPSTGLFYTDKSAKLVPELLDKIATEYPPEGGRFDLAGVSNGGLSAFKAALSYPERFRSLVVFPGYSQDGGDDPNLSKLKDIGVSMFVGGLDTGWREASEQTDETLKGLGYTVELHVVEGEPHIIASLTGADLFDAIERVRG